MKGVALAALLVAGCCRPLPGPPPTAPSPDGGWRTMRAEQKVTVTVDASRGGGERSMRALLAVERPGRFRLRALGPAGIALFDVVGVDGKVVVLTALREARGGTLLGTLVEAMAGDLQAAYRLSPGAGGRVSVAGDAVVVEEEGRTVRCREFRGRGGRSYPARIEIANRAAGYRAVIEAGETALDEPLDPQLFSVER